MKRTKAKNVTYFRRDVVARCTRLGELSEQDKWSSVVPLTCDIFDSARLCTVKKAEYVSFHFFPSVSNRTTKIDAIVLYKKKVL